jgi:hypothetical protein
MNIANTNACRKTYLGKPVSDTIWDSIEDSARVSVRNSLDNSLTYYLRVSMQYTIWSPIREVCDSILNNITL